MVKCRAQRNHNYYAGDWVNINGWNGGEICVDDCSVKSGIFKVLSKAFQIMGVKLMEW